MSDPSNEALAVMLSSLDEKMVSYQEVNEKAHDLTLEQTKRTNGRVSTLEKAFWMIAGGLVIVSAIAVPLFLDLVKSKYKI